MGSFLQYWPTMMMAILLTGYAPGTADAPKATAAVSPKPASVPPPPPVASAPPVPLVSGPPTRPFLMGFTPWPADLSLDGFQTAEQFAYAHGDIVSIMFIGGLPWPEALDHRPFSKDVQENMRYKPPRGKKLFLSVSPLDKDRRALAPYWDEKDSLPLPKPWDKEPLNSPRVKKAYLNFISGAVETMNPDYLAIGVELNVLLSREFSKWAQLKELHGRLTRR